ncbi:FimD/PapC N-terminal domain-containing protein, partial [Rahnella victoriana]
MALLKEEISAGKRQAAGIIIIISGCFISDRSLAVEFNVNFIDSADRNNVDLSRFQVAHYIAPGEYLPDVVLNGRTLGDQSLIKYIPAANNPDSRLCLPPALVDKFDLTPVAREKLTLWHQGECTSLDQQKEVTTRYDQEKQTLNISIPQAWLTFHDENWVPPSQWDEGVNGALLDYNLLGSKYMPQSGDSTTSFSSYGTTGVNLGPWRARADYQYASSRTSGTPASDKFTWTQTYVYRALPSLGARLTGGQTYFSSDIFDSFRFLGVSLNSDQRMLPPSLRGYAPQVTGIAKTNAKVSI